MQHKCVHISSSISLTLTHTHERIYIISLVESLKGVSLLNCVEDHKFSVPFPLVSLKKKKKKT